MELAPAPRIGIAIRYTKAEVVQESPMKPLALLVRGRDDYGNFEVLPSPKHDSPLEQNQKHKAIVDRIRAGIMTTAERKPAEVLDWLTLPTLRRPSPVRPIFSRADLTPYKPTVSGAKSRVLLRGVG